MQERSHHPFAIVFEPKGCEVARFIIEHIPLLFEKWEPDMNFIQHLVWSFVLHVNNMLEICHVIPHEP